MKTINRRQYLHNAFCLIKKNGFLFHINFIANFKLYINKYRSSRQENILSNCWTIYLNSKDLEAIKGLWLIHSSRNIVKYCCSKVLGNSITVLHIECIFGEPLFWLGFIVFQ